MNSCMCKRDQKGKTFRHTTKILSIVIVRLVQEAKQCCTIIVQIMGLLFWYKREKNWMEMVVLAKYCTNVHKSGVKQKYKLCHMIFLKIEYIVIVKLLFGYRSLNKKNLETLKQYYQTRTGHWLNHSTRSLNHYLRVARTSSYDQSYSDYDKLNFYKNKDLNWNQINRFLSWILCLKKMLWFNNNQLVLSWSLFDIHFFKQCFYSLFVTLNVCWSFKRFFEIFQ
jgi:hypothetical protein